jgi:hypothetical protein
VQRVWFACIETKFIAKAPLLPLIFIKMIDILNQVVLQLLKKIATGSAKAASDLYVLAPI